mmetsp:Transcript_9418/g.13771  ORF Transcript_9418/g.13771 Transcript_9418/m.13771 type:complete len:477 (+) Transcript_9418:94-1524(+)
MARVLILRIVLAGCVFFAAWMCNLDWIGLFRWSLSAKSKKNSVEQKTQRGKNEKVHKVASSSRKTKTISMPQKARIINVTIDSQHSEENSKALNDLLSASVNLIEVFLDPKSMKENGITESYSGVMGDFCQLPFDLQKKDPTTVPMFRHLVQKSNACREQRHRVDIKEFAELARKYDSRNETSAKVLSMGGAIFHESRCGSTLIANALQAMDPKRHRVYSEAQPEMVSNFCGSSYEYCSKEQASELLKDVIYIMSRSSDVDEESVFFKFHSDSARNLEVFQHAFPNTPWIFVFRDPVQIIVSQFKEGKSIAKCARSKLDPAQQAVNILQRRGFIDSPADTKDVSQEVFCAATLASYCESALKAKKDAPLLGTVVHYPDLPDILLEHVFPTSFELSMSEEKEEIIRSISGMYSKASHGRSRPYQDDSESKERKATDAIREAARKLLNDSYEQLLREAITATADDKQRLDNKVLNEEL